MIVVRPDGGGGGGLAAAVVVKATEPVMLAYMLWGFLPECRNGGVDDGVVVCICMQCAYASHRGRGDNELSGNDNVGFGYKQRNGKLRVIDISIKAYGFDGWLDGGRE